MNLLINALILSMIMSLLTLGVYLSFRVLSFVDLTTEGSFTLGAAIGVFVLAHELSPWLSLLVPLLAGMLAGALTGFISGRFNLNRLLAGFLVLSGISSYNLYLIGRNNLSLLSQTTCYASVNAWLAERLSGSGDGISRFTTTARDITTLLITGLLLLLFVTVIGLILKTEWGTALRAAGSNRRMVQWLGLNDTLLSMTGLALANGLIALSGSLLIQYHGMADPQIGLGSLAWGLFSLFIGESMFSGSKSITRKIIGVLLGSFILNFAAVLLLRWGISHNGLRGGVILATITIFILPFRSCRRFAYPARKGDNHADD